MNKYLAVYGKPRYLGIVAYDGEIANGSVIVVESHRGEELAVTAGLLTEEQEAEYRLLRNTTEHGDTANKTTEPVVTDLKYISDATEEEKAASESYRTEEDDILKDAKELLKPHSLEMKLIDVEFLLNKRKLFLYFSSEQRVDFRAYVRDLAREFKTRIELRQIGVRDEAKVIRGIGPCGRPCCCSYWLNQFAPICIKMVKEQNLALNPAKISGICGRLMCCMCYEHNVYHEMWSGLPNPGTKIKTPNGNVVLSGIELHSKCLRCFVPGHGETKVPIDKFDEFKSVVASGEEWVQPEVEQESDIPHIKELFDKFSGIDPREDKDIFPTVPSEGASAKDSREKNTSTERTRRRRRQRSRKPAGVGNGESRQNCPQIPEASAYGDNNLQPEAHSSAGGEPQPQHKRRRQRYRRKRSGSHNSTPQTAPEK